MSLRLPILAFLILSLPLFSHAQSLGDVARAVRAERQSSGTAHAKVITNDDISESNPGHEVEPKDAAATDVAAKEGDATSKPAADKQDASATADPADKKDGERKKTAQAGAEDEKGLEVQERTNEINKQYIDRIAHVRERINAAQQDLAKLQRDQIESTNDFRRSVGTAPTISEYQAQQRAFNEQIEDHRKLLTDLNSQLEDAREAARHAGVPHATDY
jgi:hypothetical protein